MMLTVPVLVVLAWSIVALLWWDGRRQVIAPAQRPWLMAAMALLVIAMLVALTAVPAAPVDLVARIALLMVAAYGLWRFAHSNTGAS